MARAKCETAQSATNAQLNGTAKTSNAPAWTVQTMKTCTRAGSNLDFPQRAGDGNAGRAKCREQPAEGPHERGEDEPPEQEAPRDAELERHFTEAGEVGRAGRHAVHRQRQRAADEA